MIFVGIQILIYLFLVAMQLYHDYKNTNIRICNVYIIHVLIDFDLIVFMFITLRRNRVYTFSIIGSLTYISKDTYVNMYLFCQYIFFDG